MSYIHWLREKGYRVPEGTVLEPDEQEEEIPEVFHDELAEYMDEVSDDKIY